MFFIHFIVNGEQWTMYSHSNRNRQIENKQQKKMNILHRSTMENYYFTKYNENFINRIFITMHIFIMKCCFFSFSVFDWFSILPRFGFSKKRREWAREGESEREIETSLGKWIIFSHSVWRKIFNHKQIKRQDNDCKHRFDYETDGMGMGFRLQGPRIQEKYVFKEFQDVHQWMG